MTLTDLVVAVTGLNATDNPAPGVGVIRALRKSALPDERFVGLAYDALDPGIYAREIVPDVFLLPYPSQGMQPFLSRLNYIQECCGIDVIIPTLDAELPAFIGVSIISAFAATVLYWNDPATVPLYLQSWLGLFLAFMLVRVVVIWQVRNNAIDNPQRLRNLVALSAGLTGAFWGLATILFNPELFPDDGDVFYRQALFGALFVADMLGIICVGPLVLAWSREGRQHLRINIKGREIEAAAVFAGLVLSTHVVFSAAPDARGWVPQLQHLTTPFLVWAALRFGLRGSASLVTSASVIYGLRVMGD